MVPRPRVAALTSVGVMGPLSVGGAATARAHVRYVTDDEGAIVSTETILQEVLGEPVTAGFVLGVGLVAVSAVVGYLRYRPFQWDVSVARETLRQYTDLAPWLLRLSIGLPLIGAGFQGYFFSPVVPASLRLFNVTIGFLLLFGLATRVAATTGLIAYLVGFIFEPDLMLASEFVGGLLAIMVLGSSRPSADQVLQRVAEAERTRYHTVDVIRRFSDWLDRRMDPYEAFAPTFVRFGLGINFIYLGFYEKIGNAGRALLVVEQYDLTDVIPIDPAMWVFGAGLTEIVLGLALLAGLFTRASATIALVMFTLTLFGLPDDPVLAHITLFGMVSMLLITGSGPLALDNRLAGRYPDLETTIEGK